MIQRMMRQDLDRRCHRVLADDKNRRRLGRLVLSVAMREEPHLLPLEEHFVELQARMTDAEHRQFRALLGHLIDQIDRAHP